MTKQFTLKNARKIFPAKYTKVRSHDLITKSIESKEYLTKKEQEKLQNIAYTIRESDRSKHPDIIIERKGKILIIKKF